MPVKLKISITKDILTQSAFCKDNPDSLNRNCAIALAVRDIFPNAIVDAEEVYPFGRRGNYYSNGTEIKLPRKAIRFIDKFDYATPEQRMKMRAVSFEIKIPDKTIKKVNISELAPLLQTHPCLELVG